MKRLNFYSFLLISSIMSGMIMTSCNKEESIINNEKSGEVIETLTNNVLIGKLSGLYGMSESVLSIAETLHDYPNSAGSLNTAKNIWFNTRENCKIAEGFPFGPGETKGLNAALDTWPVDRIVLEEILAGNDDLTPFFIRNQNGHLKGFHTIEFLLWGINGDKKDSDLTQRELEYLLAVCQVFNSDAEDLYKSWHPNHGNYAANLLNAGDGESVYGNKKEVLEDFAEGIVRLAGEMADNKIGTPLSAENHLMGESPFSNNSLSDLFDNMISIQYFYEGIWDDGLTVIIKSVDGDLDRQVRADIQAAKNAMDTFMCTFNEAVSMGSPCRAAAEKAQAAMKDLEGSLKEVKELISSM